MVLRKPLFLIISLIILATSSWAASPDKVWHSPKDTHQRLKKFSNNKRTHLATVGKSTSGFSMDLLTIDPVQSHKGPAVLVIGNISGQTPMGTEAALKLVSEILETDKSHAAGTVRWYIIPAANPDGAFAFFDPVRRTGGLNQTPTDQDKDGDFGEDPNEDLNNDSMITTMLFPDPEGLWILHEDHPEIAVKADPARGQRGLYRKETEGLDNDADGLFNEDGVGGVNPGFNFPHGFEHYRPDGGLWAADQPETRAILEFAYSHQDIAMVLVLDQNNNLRQLPEASEQGKNGLFIVPDEKAQRWKIKPGQSLTLNQLRQVIFRYNGNRNISEAQILNYLEDDAASKIDPQDKLWWSAISGEYKEYLTAAGMNEERLPSPTYSGATAQEWGYYQLGVPTFAVDFWSIPWSKPAENDSLLNEAKADTTSEKSSDDDLSNEQKAILQFAEETSGNKHLSDWKGYSSWEKVNLNNDQTVLVGGLAPYALTTPPAAQVDSLLAAPVSYLTSLPSWLPNLEWGPVELESRGSGLYELTVWLNNNQAMPYPITQGLRTRQKPPVAVTLEGAEILEGRPRAIIEKIPGHGSAKVRWLIRVSPGDKLKLSAEAPSLGRISRQLTVSDQEGSR
ncbi:MAG: hypothetical protein GY780_12360 [bacterium]|nr:hypothetical protein [bacterium]